jgi:hypothetical protein
MRTCKLIVTLAVAAFAAGTQAQDRPSEDELFGGPQAPAQPAKPADQKPPDHKPDDKAGDQKSGEPKPAPPPAGATGPHGELEGQLFGPQSSPLGAPPPSGNLFSREKEDWLKIGGLLQMQGQVSAYEDTAPRDWILTSPNLLDVYLDARPNDRVRGFVLGRMNYDPTAANTSIKGGTITGLSASSTSNPGAVLDQMWINFDVYHRAFVTAGRQHVKWGVGKIWNPTDYLHTVPRNPLATFDVRTGTTMVKVHVPWEKRGWNFYAMGILEDIAGNTEHNAGRLSRLGIGGRAELVLANAELGLDAVAQDGHHARYGIDISRGVGDFDVYGEAALRSGGDSAQWTRQGPPPPGPFPSLMGWTPEHPQELTPQIVAGASWSWKYSDEDSLTVGAEYFYNDLGYADKAVYPFLLLGAPTFTTGPLGVPVPDGQQDPTAFRPFYLGRHYVGVNLLLPKPGRWNDTTVILSGIANLSDKTWVARLDTTVLVLTYLTVETFVAAHFGPAGGEFKLVVPADVRSIVGSQSGTVSFPSGAPLVDVGVSLRVSL